MKWPLRLIKWSVTIVFLLVGVFVAYIKYLEWSFDDEVFPENHGQINAQLFMQNNGQVQPLIVGFGGSEGGNAWASDYWQEQRNTFLEQGYALLAVGYFGMPDTPQHLDRIALDAIHKAIQEYADRPDINKNCIALIGGSKGAELVLSLASHYDSYKSVVAIVPGYAVFPSLTPAMTTSSFSLNGEQLAFVPVPWSAAPALLRQDLRAAFGKMMENEQAIERARIQVEKIRGSILFLSATDDEMWPSKEMSDSMMTDLKLSNFPYTYKHIAVTGNHSAPLNHFADVETFLRENFCSD